MKASATTCTVQLLTPLPDEPRSAPTPPFAIPLVKSGPRLSKGGARAAWILLGFVGDNPPEVPKGTPGTNFSTTGHILKTKM